MSKHPDIYDAHQRARFMRHDAARFMRCRRAFMKSGIFCQKPNRYSKIRRLERCRKGVCSQVRTVNSEGISGTNRIADTASLWKN